MPLLCCAAQCGDGVSTQAFTASPHSIPSQLIIPPAHPLSSHTVTVAVAITAL